MKKNKGIKLKVESVFPWGSGDIFIAYRIIKQTCMKTIWPKNAFFDALKVGRFVPVKRNIYIYTHIYTE